MFYESNKRNITLLGKNYIMKLLLSLNNDYVPFLLNLSGTDFKTEAIPEIISKLISLRFLGEDLDESTLPYHKNRDFPIFLVFYRSYTLQYKNTIATLQIL